ncbi:MAG: FMN-binding protein, partial [Butyricicoccus sp.]
NDHGETPGLGAKSQSDWIDQYAGMPADGSLKVTKDGGTVTPITGATITSRAVTLGVNTAANYVASLG